MPGQLILTSAVSVGVVLCTVVIHALALMTVVRFVRRQRRLGRAGRGFWTDVGIVACVVLLAFAAHVVEIAAWTPVYVVYAKFPSLILAFRYSAGNYTTLGSSDVVMSASGKLLAPLEAVDAMLCFGVSTAMIFTVIQQLVQTRYG